MTVLKVLQLEKLQEEVAKERYQSTTPTWSISIKTSHFWGAVVTTWLLALNEDLKSTWNRTCRVLWKKERGMSQNVAKFEWMNQKQCCKSLKSWHGLVFVNTKPQKDYLNIKSVCSAWSSFIYFTHTEERVMLLVFLVLLSHYMRTWTHELHLQSCSENRFTSISPLH